LIRIIFLVGSGEIGFLGCLLFLLIITGLLCLCFIMFILIRLIMRAIISFSKCIIATASKSRFISFLVDAIFIVFCLIVIGFFVKVILICYEVTNFPF
jgi:hypothetical protein